MKERPDGFLADIFKEPTEHPEVVEYIQEVHEYLWSFVRAEFPWAYGNLKDYVKIAVQSAEYHSKQRTEIVELLDKRGLR